MMLVLARKEGEAVLIGDDTWVRVVSLGQNTVRLGVEAPPDVRILREELVDDDVVRDTAKVPALLRNHDGAK
jgi:carbon storage regulator